MKCPACGLGMLRRKTYCECSNILCDYEEDIANNGVLLKSEQIASEMKQIEKSFSSPRGGFPQVNKPARTSNFTSLLSSCISGII